MSVRVGIFNTYESIAYISFVFSGDYFAAANAFGTGDESENLLSAAHAGNGTRFAALIAKRTFCYDGKFNRI